MFFVAFRILDDPLITMGDGVASFLEKADPTTKDMCLLSIHDVRKNGSTNASSGKMWPARSAV
jgi:hypothetical protein